MTDKLTIVDPLLYEVPANGVTSTLAVDLGVDDVTLTLVDATDFPFTDFFNGSQYHILISDETNYEVVIVTDFEDGYDNVLQDLCGRRSHTTEIRLNTSLQQDLLSRSSSLSALSRR